MRAIKVLYPDADADLIREQLFSKYDKKELRSFANLDESMAYTLTKNHGIQRPPV